MRKQLRSFYTADQLTQVYNHTYDHTFWADHRERVAKTIELLDTFAAKTDSRTIADLSCGDGAIVLGSRHPWEKVTLGDYTTTGPIEDTLYTVGHVDMFVLSETLEHVEDPDTLLAMLRVISDHLILTTPHGEDHDENPEHYWGWDSEALHEMLYSTGWTDLDCQLFTPESNGYYTFQMWRCS